MPNNFFQHLPLISKSSILTNSYGNKVDINIPSELNLLQLDKAKNLLVQNICPCQNYLLDCDGWTRLRMLLLCTRYLSH